MNELVMRLCTLLTVVFAVSTTLWLAGMVQAQQALGIDVVEASQRPLHVASAKMGPQRVLETAARPVEQAASAALSYTSGLR